MVVIITGRVPTDTQSLHRLRTVARAPFRRSLPIAMECATSQEINPKCATGNVGGGGGGLPSVARWTHHPRNRKPQ